MTGRAGLAGAVILSSGGREIGVKGQKIATISGQNFAKGDFAFGKRVAQIFKNRVVLDDGGKEENLILEGTKFTIRKHMQN